MCQALLLNSAQDLKTKSIFCVVAVLVKPERSGREGTTHSPNLLEAQSRAHTQEARTVHRRGSGQLGAPAASTQRNRFGLARFASALPPHRARGVSGPRVAALHRTWLLSPSEGLTAGRSQEATEGASRGRSPLPSASAFLSHARRLREAPAPAGRGAPSKAPSGSLCPKEAWPGTTSSGCSLVDGRGLGGKPPLTSKSPEEARGHPSDGHSVTLCYMGHSLRAASAGKDRKAGVANVSLFPGLRGQAQRAPERSGYRTRAEVVSG